MRSLGIDYGRRRIGLALSDPTMFLASPYLIIENKGIKKNIARLADIITKNEVGLIVIGLPLHANGDESEMSIEVRQFGQSLVQAGYKVEYFDERYSSFTAEELIGDSRRKDLIDKVAASVILQMYLDERRKLKNEG